MPSTTELVAKMAQALAGAGANLGDERQCIRVLQSKFEPADILIHLDAARIEAQKLVVSR